MRNVLNAIFLLIIIALSVVSCEKKSITYDKIDILTFPSLTARDFTTTYTDSGNIQLILAAPLMETFDREDEPYSEFKKGLEVFFHDGHEEPVASVTAKYAKYVDEKKLWELKDSVVAVNEAGERLETELLYWDQKKALIYTDRFVKITTEDQIIQGYGLESDPRLSKRRIKNLSAIIYIEEEE
ncbi:MAG: LPS export ABC transporter periplasmic protein LptC [Bacteroidales bacterium]|jgi:LPS export ABC transporter protein LptC|nr:LPS export ABC transporter periplasmic protein LptC [Bacteroidales bacterium]